MDHIQFPYRSEGHLALMHVVAESGAFERNNLDVSYDKEISRSDAHQLVGSGQVEFTSGNHVSTYAARARGDKWVYLGQTVSLNHLALVTQPDSGVEKVEDLRKRKFGSRGRHPGLNDWLYLKQSGLDVDKDDVEFLRFGSASEDPRRRNMGIMDAVKTGEVDGAFMSLPRREFALRQGLKVIPIPPQPMIFFATISTSMPFAQKNPDIVKRLLKSMLEGIAFFKNEKEKTIDILLARHVKEGQLDREVATMLYGELAATLEPKMIPSLAAIANVYEEAKRQDPESGKIDPLALWDFHHLRELDDEGFIDSLYPDKSKMRTSQPGDAPMLLQGVNCD